MFPHRMNLVDIEIRQILKSITPLDPDFREPVSSAALSSVVIVRGQANLGNKRFERTFRTHTGDVAESEGHLVFRKQMSNVGSAAVPNVSPV